MRCYSPLRGNKCSCQLGSYIQAWLLQEKEHHCLLQVGTNEFCKWYNPSRCPLDAGSPVICIFIKFRAKLWVMSSNALQIFPLGYIQSEMCSWFQQVQVSGTFLTLPSNSLRWMNAAELRMGALGPRVWTTELMHLAVCSDKDVPWSRTGSSEGTEGAERCCCFCTHQHHLSTGGASSKSDEFSMSFWAGPSTTKTCGINIQQKVGCVCAAQVLPDHFQGNPQ